ncbi:MAG: hypothetical protein ACLUNZ_00090 [Evtepia sp.]
MKILLANGAARVLAVPVADESGYAAAFALVQEQEGVNVVICDSEKLAVQQKLRDSVMSASAERRDASLSLPEPLGKRRRRWSNGPGS